MRISDWSSDVCSSDLSLAAYSYIKMSNRWPSSGGIAMILQKAYGPGVVAASASLLMALSMVINESLVARTFATYALRPFGLESSGILVSVAALALIVFAYFVNEIGRASCRERVCQYV